MPSFQRPLRTRRLSPVQPVVAQVDVVTHRGVPLTVAFEAPWRDRLWEVQHVLLYVEGACAGYVRVQRVSPDALASHYADPLVYLREIRGHCDVFSMADLERTARGAAADLIAQAERAIAWERARTVNALVEYAYVSDGHDRDMPIAFRRHGILAASYIVIATSVANRGGVLQSPMNNASEATPVWDFLASRGYVVRHGEGERGNLRSLDCREGAALPQHATARRAELGALLPHR